jgi:hypothetical protein
MKLIAIPSRCVFRDYRATELAGIAWNFAWGSREHRRWSGRQQGSCSMMATDRVFDYSSMAVREQSSSAMA